MATTAIRAKPIMTKENTFNLQQSLIITARSSPCNVPRYKKVPAATEVNIGSMSGYCPSDSVARVPVITPRGSMSAKTIKRMIPVLRLRLVLLI